MIAQPRKNIMDMFIDGARRGFTIATTSLLPNVVMAFVIIQALKVTGLLDIVGNVCEPVMALWGLPGAAATVLLASVMSMGGGVGVCASLVAAGSTGRCLGTAGVNPKYYPHIITVCVINALLSMWVMQLLF
ncbi:YjiG family protein [Enterobacter kobei]|uniref:YjiG family protein n=1 Tax=Enterobacter kobei TaxID=208224 RepID=UPI000B8E42D3|nr:YjiG family protein [Enterobacter kobei]OXV22388.1 hypothetical protein CDL31_26635 [Enterobacter kobei]